MYKCKNDYALQSRADDLAKSRDHGRLPNVPLFFAPCSSFCGLMQIVSDFTEKNDKIISAKFIQNSANCSPWKRACKHKHTIPFFISCFLLWGWMQIDIKLSKEHLKIYVCQILSIFDHSFVCSLICRQTYAPTHITKILVDRVIMTFFARSNMILSWEASYY